MTKSSLFLLFLFLVFKQSFSQLQWLNPRPSGYINTKMIFVNSDTGFIINYNGDLLRTNNRGGTWQVQQNFPGARPALDLKDSTGVIPCYDGTVYITTDNGNTWHSNATGLIGLSEWANVVSRDTILISQVTATWYNKLHRSSDRGKTWQVINEDLRMFFPVVNFVNSKIGYGRGVDGLCKTTDGGKTWSVSIRNGTSSQFTAIKFLNESVGYTYKEGDSIYRTSNGGDSWTKGGRIGFDVNDFFIVNDSVAYAGADDGVIYRTGDRGKNWDLGHPKPFGDRFTILSLHFLNDTAGFATGYRGRILKTGDGGKNWTAYSPNYIDISSLSFGSSSTGYATSWNNIYKTVDKGQTWSQLSYAVGGTHYYDYARFSGGVFFSADTGILTSTSPVRVHRTTDGGQTWTDTTLPSIVPYDFISGLSFANSKTGYAVGRGSVNNLLRTVDGGVTWQIVGNYQNLRSICFLNDSMGYATGSLSVYRTIDSGKTWTAVLTDDFHPGFEKLYFTTPGRGFIYSDQAYLKMTIDSGKTWKWIYPPDLYQDIIALSFFNDTIGYLTTDYGKIYKTQDGGTTWWKSDVKPYDLNHISFGRDSSVYFGGVHGSILGGSISDYSIDSLTAKADSSCSVELSAIVRSVLSKVDSIWFDYGAPMIDKSILASPQSIENGIIKASAVLRSTVYNTTYMIRLRVLYKGNYYYSEPIEFTSQSMMAPVINASGNVLSSSYAAGNQWFLNGVVINGATGREYIATTPGVYTVQVTQNGCSVLSQPYNYMVTSVYDPVLAQSIAIYPNPFHNRFTVRNETFHKLQYRVFDVTGRTLMILVSDQKEVHVQQAFSSAIYFMEIRDTRTGRIVIYKLVKD